MSGMSLTFTSGGLAALVNAQATGSAAVQIARVGLASAPFTPAGTLTALPNEIKRVTTFGGSAVDPATIHISIRDDSDDAYDLFGFGLYLADNTLFAVYAQQARILGKAAISQALIALDVRLGAAVAGAITFGATNFLDPAASTERAGLVELATVGEATAGTDAQRAVTPAGLKAKADAVLAAAAVDATAKINALINAAPGALDTLSELATALGNDASFATTITNLIATRKTEAIAAAAIDATTKADASLASAKTYADTKKAEAISAAATDATSKDATNLAAAKTYADTKKAEAITASAADATAKINALVNAAPGALDTLAELATALGNDANFAATITNLISTRKAEAIAAAATDATTKADAAKTAAIAAVVAMFTGANQNLAVPGFQKWPGGWMLQWGLTPVITGDTLNNYVAFDQEFPTECFGVLPVHLGGTSVQGGGSVYGLSIQSSTKAGFTMVNDSVAGRFFYIALGK